jgi:hypothetical protein
MKPPEYITLTDSVQALSEIGIDVNLRQMQRASEPDAFGKRKLPFFKDPIDGRLKINKQSLLKVYMQCEVDAERNIRNPDL